MPDNRLFTGMSDALIQLTGRESLDDTGGNQWHHDLMVPNQIDPTSAFCGRSAYDICHRSVVADKIKIDSGKVFQFTAKIASDRQRFQKHFRQDNR